MFFKKCLLNKYGYLKICIIPKAALGDDNNPERLQVFSTKTNYKEKVVTSNPSTEDSHFNLNTILNNFYCKSNKMFVYFKLLFKNN